MDLVNSMHRGPLILHFNPSQIFQGERMTAALLERLIHHCHSFEINGESYRFKQSVKRSTKLRKTNTCHPIDSGLSYASDGLHFACPGLSLLRVYYWFYCIMIFKSSNNFECKQPMQGGIDERYQQGQKDFMSDIS